jgi:hypothetical protein
MQNYMKILDFQKRAIKIKTTFRIFYGTITYNCYLCIFIQKIKCQIINLIIL